MRAVGLILCLALLGCFPHDAHKRTLAKYAEGASLVAGIGIEFIASMKTGADCDQGHVSGIPTSGCHTSAAITGDVGLGLILAGLVGFVATISSAEDDKANTPPTSLGSADIRPDAKDLKLPPGVKPAAKAVP